MFCREGIGGACASEDVDRLKGLLRAGYACMSSVGMGGGTSLLFALLKAFRRDAKEDFFANGELLVVATDDCVECVNGALLDALRAVPLVAALPLYGAENPES